MKLSSYANSKLFSNLTFTAEDVTMESDGGVRIFDQPGHGLAPEIPTLCNQLEFVLRGQLCMSFTLLDVICVYIHI